MSLFENWFVAIIQAARKIRDHTRKEQLPIAFVGKEENGKLLMDVLPIAMIPKESWRQVLRAIALELRPDYIVIVSEAWAVALHDNPDLFTHKNRQEVILITAEEVDFNRMVRVPILADGTTGDPPDEDVSNMIGGNLVGLLLPSDVENQTPAEA